MIRGLLAGALFPVDDHVLATGCQACGQQKVVDEHTAVLTIDRNLCARYGLGETTAEDGPKLDALLGNLCMVLRDLTRSKVH